MLRKKAVPPPEPEPSKRRSPGLGSVLVRGDGRIAAILPKDLDPKRRPHYGPGRRRRFADRDGAEAWLDAEIRRRRAPPATASADEQLGSYLTRWYRLHEAEWPERTRKAYQASLRRWRTIGTIRLGVLTREHVQEVLAALRVTTWQRQKKDGTPVGEPKPYAARTIQHARAVLHQALDELIPEVLSHNPARGRRRGRALPEPSQPVWSAEQAGRFLTVAERTVPHVALAFRLILRRGLRTGEAVALTWSDVDERAGTLTIDETAGIARGTSGPTKTRRVRDVPLSADLTARLRAHRREHPATDPHIFTSEGRQVSLGHFRHLWHRTVRVAGLPPITPKDGRATCATILLDEGRPLPEVSQLLGHANVATTARFYQRTIKRRAEQVVQLGETIDAALERAARSGTGEDAAGS